MSIEIESAQQVADMAEASQTQLETLMLPGSVEIAEVNTARSTTADDLYTYFLAKLKVDYKIEFKANGVVSIWNADAGVYMDITAEGEDDSEDLNFSNN